MVRSPGLELTASLQRVSEVRGLVADAVKERAKRILSRIVSHVTIPDGAQVRIEILSVPPEHQGLGTGTQLSLAIAAAVGQLLGIRASAVELSRWTERGGRSAIGIHGFDHGGFLVDGGKSTMTNVAPLVARMEFPSDWPVLLIAPDRQTGIFGTTESSIFSQKPMVPPGVTERLAYLALMGMLPALAERDYVAFSHALFEFNHTVGALFAFAQGGPYASPRANAMVDFLRELGVAAVGQSSWGPTLFCVASDLDHAGWIVGRLCQAFSLDEDHVVVTKADNCGAQLAEVPAHV